MTTRDPTSSWPRRRAMPGVLACLLLSAPVARAQQAPPGPSAAAALAHALDAAPSTPHLAAACAPAGQVLEGLGQVLSAMGSAGMEPAEAALVSQLASVEGMAALGLDPQGALGLTLWNPRVDPVGVLSLPFAGDAAAARAMLAGLGAQVEDVPGATDRWQIAASDGTVSLARLHAGVLELAFDGEPPAQTELPPRDLPLVQGLPADPGCAIWVALGPGDLPATPALKLEQGLSGSIFVPFGRGGMGLLRFRSPKAAPTSLQRQPAAPVLGSSEEAPSLVIAIGLSMEDLLTDPALLEAARLSPAKARKVVKRVHIAGGTTIAAFGQPQSLDLVAVLPLDAARGPVRPEKVVARVERLARRADVPVIDRTEDGLVLSVRNSVTHLRVRDGRVYVGSNAARVDQAASGQGRPWAGPDELGWASQWPVAMWSGPDGPTAVGLELSVRAGVRAVDDVMEVGIQVQTDAPPGMLFSLLAAALNQG